MTESVRHDEAQLLAGVFAYPRLELVRGEGSWVWDAAGKRYLDFTAGLAVAALGHGRTDLADVLREQYVKIGHVSNLYANGPALELASRLVQSSFARCVWYANSGTEANEAVLKFARVTQLGEGHVRKTEVLAFRGGFHGRTLGALSVTYQPSYRKPFAPLLPGVRFADFNDMESVRKQWTDRIGLVLVEPVQGEGGVVPAAPEFLRELRRQCDASGALLAFDEVQTGIGRLGTLYAYQSYGIEPDLVSLAKPLGGGLPLGAVLVGPRVAPHLKPGQHGSTFSGGPAVCAVGTRVFDIVSDAAFLANVQARARELRAGLDRIAAAGTVCTGARGAGLLQALVLAPRWKKRGAELVASARERGLLVTRAGQDAVRLLPPLVCTPDEIAHALGILEDVLKSPVKPRGRKPGAAARPDANPVRRTPDASFHAPAAAPAPVHSSAARRTS